VIKGKGRFSLKAARTSNGYLNYEKEETGRPGSVTTRRFTGQKEKSGKKKKMTGGRES